MNATPRAGGKQHDGWHGEERVVFNYNGRMLIDLDGRVVACNFDETLDGSGMMPAAVVRSSRFRNVTRVDLDEWESFWGKEAAMETDILDVAYWYRLPDEPEEIYQPADSEWRADWKRLTEQTRSSSVDPDACSFRPDGD